MPTLTDPRSNNLPRNQDDRGRQPPNNPGEEPRDFETHVSDGDRNYDASFDDELEPIEAEDINTHGSER